MNPLILIGIFFIFTFLIGILLEKIKIPWLFASLMFGLLVSFYNPFGELVSGGILSFFSNLGLYLLLFLIGFELDLVGIKKMGWFLIKTTFFIEMFEVVLVGTFLHFVFGISWLVAVVVSLSFATVGEAILLPILDEFKITKSKLGQVILGVATLDDVNELFTIVAVVVLTPILTLRHSPVDSLIVKDFFSFVIISAILMLVFLILKGMRKSVSLMNVPSVAAALPFLFSIFFLTTGIGSETQVDLSVIAALFTGLVLRNSLQKNMLEELEPEIKTITYGLFAPFFFFSVGLETQFSYLLKNLSLIALVISISYFAKIIGSLLAGRSEIGTRPAVFMGVALGMRFSTSLVILKILLDKMIIGKDLYTVLIGTSIIFPFVIPFLLSYLDKMWDIKGRYSVP
jgi:Kef-type K+ transport system membrane component KefB